MISPPQPPCEMPGAAHGEPPQTSQRPFSRVIAGSSVIQKLTGEMFAAALVFTWVIASGLGLLGLARYAARPGETVSVAEQVSLTRELIPAGEASALLVFLHPHCSCSRATVNELARIVAATSEQVPLRILVGYPDVQDHDGWMSTSLIDAAARLPGAVVIPDPRGAIAQSFGVATSGHCLLVDHNGTVLFSGGITRARGHEGNNAGRSTLARTIGKPRSGDTLHFNTYGCALVALSTEPELATRTTSRGGGAGQ